MDNGINPEENRCLKMGASSNPNAARLAALQERKQSIEETLAKRNQELRQLCIQEAELTGIMPTEIPLEPGESPPVFRRRVGTTFQLPQNLINNINSEEESITSLELNMQIQANMAEAALSLANEANIGKMVRRKHMAQYQYHKRQYNTLEDKLTFLKTYTQAMQQPNASLQKQKKKPRPVEQEDLVSMNVNIQHAEPFGKSVFRHSMRSLQHPLLGENNIEYVDHQKLAYRNSEDSPNSDPRTSLVRPEDALVSGIYRLSLNGYKAYMDRKESGHIISNSHLLSSQSNPNLYQHQAPQPIQYSQGNNHTLPHSSQRTQQSVHSYVMYSQYNPTIQHDYSKYNNNNQPRQSISSNSASHTSNYSKVSYYPTTFYPNRKYTNVDQQFRTLNPHQIQPHQQYEHDVMTAGLGGCWKRTESGETIWCNSVSNDTWQREKRFGSLDRRRNKRLHKRTSPLVDSKSATISVVMSYPESIRPVPAKPQQIINRNKPDKGQLVRTQSLGSVGVQTIDSVWPSDDNSSCGSDAQSINEINMAARKQKQKEWFETSLDSPALPTPTRSHSTVSSSTTSKVPSISSEEKYLEIRRQSLSSPQIHKPPLEIPAESNPHASPTIHEPNMELFNNNIPKNGTLIQAGQCKPYHEETKPFEMSDFYKYSTKFKKSPVKHNENMKISTDSSLSSQLSPTCSVQRNLSESFEDDNASVIQKGIYQPLQPMKCQPYNLNDNYNRSAETVGSPDSTNTSLDLNQFTSNIVEKFSAEMNTWFQNHEQQLDNNNSGRPGSSNRSTATLV